MKQERLRLKNEELAASNAALEQHADVLRRRVAELEHTVATLSSSNVRLLVYSPPGALPSVPPTFELAAEMIVASQARPRLAMPPITATVCLCICKLPLILYYVLMCACGVCLPCVS